MWEIPFVITVFCLTLVECRECWYSYRGRTRVFFCSTNQQCCNNACCILEQAFYTLWYFWLTVLLLLFLCGAGIYWIRRNYIYHRLLAVPGWASQQLAQHTLRSGTQITEVKVSVETPNLSLNLPPYSPPINPPPYSEADPGGPPCYNEIPDNHREKTIFTEEPTH